MPNQPTDEQERVALLPCGFCGAEPEPYDGDDPQFQGVYFHPGTSCEGDCFLRGRGIPPADHDLWNTRAALSTPPPPYDAKLTAEEESELVERINGNWYLQPNDPAPPPVKAADAEIERLREVLRKVRTALSCPTCMDWCDRNPACAEVDAALSEQEPNP